MSQKTTLIIDSEQLKEISTLLLKTSERASASIPVLSHVLIDCKGDKCVLMTTNLSDSFSITIQPVESADFIAALPARKLFDIAKTAGHNTSIKLSLDGLRCIIKTKTSRFTLNCLPPGDFPKTTAPDEFVMSFDYKSLLPALKSVSHAMATNDARYVLNGTLLSFEQSKLVLVATDGHRLAIDSVDATDTISEPVRCIIPNSAVHSLLAMKGMDNDKIVVSLSQNTAAFAINNTLFQTKTIDGSYPNYKAVIPKNNYTLKFDAVTFKSALTRCSILTNGQQRGVTLQIDGQSLTLESNNAGEEAATESLDGELVSTTEDSFVTTFCIDYLKDAIDSTNGNEFLVNLSTNTNSPTVIITRPDESPLTCVVMGMRA